MIHLHSYSCVANDRGYYLKQEVCLSLRILICLVVPYIILTVWTCLVFKGKNPQAVKQNFWCRNCISYSNNCKY